MAMKKAEMAAESLQYRILIDRAAAAERSGLYREAMRSAVAAWPYVDGMVLHARKYGDAEVTAIAAIDLVLRYAPLLLDTAPLDDLERLLAGYKRVLKDAYAPLAERLAQARSQIWENHRLWTHLERHPAAEQDRLREALGGDQARWRAVAEAWERMGLLTRAPLGRSYALTLATRMGEVIRGKCPRCGRVEQAPKAMFLEPVTCPKCKVPVSFVLLSPPPPPQPAEPAGA